MKYHSLKEWLPAIISAPLPRTSPCVLELTRAGEEAMSFRGNSWLKAEGCCLSLEMFYSGKKAVSLDLKIF